MEIDIETLRKLFPNLAKELEFGGNKVAINSVRTDVQAGEKAATRDLFANYNPDVIDFIRRCDTEDQAMEIIEYMERRGDIGAEYAEKLRKQLKEKGVRSFGPKKEYGYYFRRAGLC